MKSRQFKSHASSGRLGGAAAGTFGAGSFSTGQTSVLSYIQEPPNLSTISDANVTVAFKNLSKKDETTKAKALDDVQIYVGSPDHDIEDGILEAWAKLFPRLSIDNSRRVRQTTHVLNGQLCTKSGKRIAKFLPRTAGPWLAGTFDSDRSVSRAAIDSLHLVFPTKEKVQGLRKAFQRSILEYCRDAIFHETVQTLSDERTVTPEDAQATYARVVGTCVAVVSSLLIELNRETIDSDRAIYEEILQDAKLWDFVNFSDANVRRSVHRLVQTCLVRMPDPLHSDAQTISNAYVYKGLHSDQTGSVVDYLQTLEALTTVMPTIWTEAYRGKKPAISRLRGFLKRGSQSAANAFWECVNSLLPKIPSQVLPKTAQEIDDLLSGARDGVTRKEERFNSSAAWSTYFGLAELLTSSLSQVDADPIVESQLIPVIRQYIFPDPDTAEWSILGAKASSVVSRIVTVQNAIRSVAKIWPEVSQKLIEIAQLSQPEQSRDFEKSQKHVATTGERWTELQREIWNAQSMGELPSVFVAESQRVMSACITLLKARNAKPYGAAAIIEQLLRTCSTHLMREEIFSHSYFTFAMDELPGMIFSPSQRHLVHGLYATSAQPAFRHAFETILHGILEAPESTESKVTALNTMFTASMPQEAISVAKDSQQFQAFLTGTLSTPGTTPVAILFAEVIKLGVASPATIDTVLSNLIAVLAIPDNIDSVLPALEALSLTGPGVINTYNSRSDGAGSQLLPNLMKLEQGANDEVAEWAAALSAKLSTSANGNAGGKYSMVLQSLEDASTAALSIEAVIELAFRLMGPEKQVQNAADVLPAMDAWLISLRTAMQPPRRSLALLSPFGGTIHLLHREITSMNARHFDAEGFSPALRMAMYAARLLRETNLLAHIGETQAAVFAILHVILLAADDNISVRGSNDLFSMSCSPQDELAILDFISETNKLLDVYWSSLSPDLSSNANTGFTQLDSSLAKLREGDDSSSAFTYYTWLSYSVTLANLFDARGYSQNDVAASEALLKGARSANQLLPLVALVSGARQPLSGSPALTRFENELASDLTDMDIVSSQERALEKLILLNAVLRTQEDMISAIAKQRLVFLVKSLIRGLQEAVPTSTQAEICKALTGLLPGMQDMYGEHWEAVLSYLINCWSSSTYGESNNDDGILLMNASLRLWSVLNRFATSQDSNDDLVDAVKEKTDEARDALIHLLINTDGANDDANQPLQITHDLLARQLAALPPKLLQQAGEIYPLLNSRSRPIMQAAFDLLHTDIPAAQEQISFDAALDDKTAHLPDELLSLILEAPTLDSLADASFDRMMPLSLQEYLYSWRLLFDHFDGSSFRVKNDYIDQLKEGGYLTGLLNFTFDFLGHTRGKPVDVSKFDIPHYVPDIEPSPEKDVQWLLTHLYFLALTHTPNLVKSYYLDVRSRQTSSAIETWTAKYLSPRIISSALQSVAEWAEKSVKEDPDYEKMTVKVGMRSKEINVSYEVDEQTMAIKVILPDAYPLASAQVVSVNRVAAKEMQWQSWLRNCQGVITFSNGSIIDGLAAWRKNVTGALKGQSECAICYSIISADKQLPTKRCPTCKHLFHASCLFKWFKTSNASTCPLCRNPFNFN